ncbi:hypothetical protein PV08_04834 [Exophiala spinifera]|uniref:Uncharacterized protein n=1 Tax=Exophiala spinifera TaxID=91928 RepID=A0A0D2C1W1_9EURO|nr:uncharacterized protein PV08_04834 [Exophiala spinifera]KIW17639.1 hypothetical protein PV08_04834 [Exophiala spinifera]
MCITEIWTYRDCGCRYNHSILCRSYRRGGTPCFAPNIQYPRDKWLEGAGIDNALTFRQFKGRTKPTEPQACPQHRTVYRSFLNPVCEDCLLAGVNWLSGDGIGPVPLTYPESEAAGGEGLVWDSEVKVEIESQSLQDQPVPSTTASDMSSHNSKDIDRTILDSHVEVTIESEGSRVSACEPPPSHLSSSHGEDSWFPSTGATSPESLGSCEQRYSDSSSEEKCEDSSGDDLSSDLGDSDDEGADSCDDQHCQHLPARGRSLVRGNGSVMKRSVTDPAPLLMPVEKSKSTRGLSTLRSIRSISLNFRSGSKTKVHAAPSEHLASGNEQCKLARSRSKNPFRAFRRRKGSQNYANTTRITHMLTTLEVHSSLEVDQLSFEKPRLRPLPPRKSSTGNLRSFTEPVQAGLGRRWFPGMAHQIQSPGPTGYCSQNHKHQEKGSHGFMCDLPVHKDVPFASQSDFSDFEPEETAQSSAEKSPPSHVVVRPTLQSSNDLPLRARIHGLETFELGLGASTSFPSNHEAQLSALDQEVNTVENAVPMVASTAFAMSKPQENFEIHDFASKHRYVADEDQDQETVLLDPNDATREDEIEAHSEETGTPSMLDPSEGFELISLSERKANEGFESDEVETDEQYPTATEPTHATLQPTQSNHRGEAEIQKVEELESEVLLVDMIDGSERVDSHIAETDQHSVEHNEPDQEQMFPESIPTIRILETDQIISLYSYARKPKRQAPEKIEEVVSDDVSEATAVSEDGDDSKISDLTTPPSSPLSIEKGTSPVWPSHPPRKSSLKRLTGFNYSLTPVVDPDFPTPSLPSTMNFG